MLLQQAVWPHTQERIFLLVIHCLLCLGPAMKLTILSLIQFAAPERSSMPALPAVGAADSKGAL